MIGHLEDVEEIGDPVTVGKTKRASLDFYPTPTPVTRVLHDWLVARDLWSGRWTDPAAGAGHLMRGMSGVAWSGIEIDPTRAALARQVAPTVCGDGLAESWGDAHVAANPPFSLLDEFWSKCVEHRAAARAVCAVFTPVAFWNAEKRADYTSPDCVLNLCWRPTFRDRNGFAHKGMQDFCWSILLPTPATIATWERAKKPARTR